MGAGMQGPVYAVEDETAIEVISEWELETRVDIIFSAKRIGDGSFGR